MTAPTDTRHDEERLPRVVILGGGMAGLTTALELSKPGWDEHFDAITLYQQGWRLGGKGASGRGEHDRIQEHGLHIWLGFYFNAFHLLRRCHEELDWRERECDEPRWPLAFRSMHASFRACDSVTISDDDPGGWTLWEATFGNAGGVPPWHDDAGVEDPSVLNLLFRSLQLAADLLISLPSRGPDEWFAEPDLPTSDIGGMDLSGGVATRAYTAAAPQAEYAAGVLRACADGLESVYSDLGSVLGSAAGAVIDAVLGAVDIAALIVAPAAQRLWEDSDEARRLTLTIELLLTIARGIVKDDLLVHEDLDRIDHLDLRDWLRGHGASEAAVEFALVRTVVYDLMFAYEGGDQARPRAGAGTALRGLMLLFFHYSGSIMWKMNAGMGDVVFAPMFEVLVKRGVDIRFFHRVERVTTHRRRGHKPRVETIEIDRQSNVKAKPRRYLTDRGLWPADPRTILDVDPDIEPAAYESWFMGRDAARVGSKTLHYAADDADGFEIVVFAMPIGCVPLVAKDLMRLPAWQRTVEHVATTPTQAVQLWLRRPIAKLSHANTGAILGGYVEPYDTWADMDQLVEQEAVPGSATVAYFCSATIDARPPVRGTPEAYRWLRDQHELVRDRTIQFLRTDIGGLWLGAIDGVTSEFDWKLLAAPHGTHGVERLDAQFWIANFEPSERYTLSVPGSSMYRIDPEDTGISNLYAAGDWTRCQINAGCIEAAVISGMLAANGIHLDLCAEHRVQPVRCWCP